MAFDTLTTSSPEKNKINYLSLLQSIEQNNGRLKGIAQKFLTRPDLIALVKAKTDKNFNAYGVNSIEDTDSGIIRIKGITLNPQQITEELALHELIHFFSMPALRGAFTAQQKNEFDTVAENVKTYWTKTKLLWDYVKSKGYQATNSHSMTDDIVEFAVNFTNQESEEKLKAINAYDALVSSFFEYYNSIKIR